MMKTKSYRNGKLTCKSYLKSAGNGWEVGFKYGAKNVFLGNFVNAKEANEWYRLMNQEIRLFASRYRVSKKFPTSRYSHFLGAHLHNKYYQFLGKCFARNRRTWNRELNKDLRTFRRMTRTTPARDRVQFLKAA